MAITFSVYFLYYSAMIIIYFLLACIFFIAIMIENVN